MAIKGGEQDDVLLFLVLCGAGSDARKRTGTPTSLLADYRRCMEQAAQRQTSRPRLAADRADGVERCENGVSPAMLGSGQHDYHLLARPT